MGEAIDQSKLKVNAANGYCNANEEHTFSFE